MSKSTKSGLIKYNPENSGIYIHFPYCIQKCSYCDFYSIGVGIKPEIEQEKLFTNYLKELDFRISREPILKSFLYDTIFFGGGTPSLMDEDLLRNFLENLKQRLDFSANLEISLEANPEDISENKILSWNQLGINRINVGIQSFLPKGLQFLERFYDEEKYNSVMDVLSKKIIPRYGIDLIYGIVGVSEEEFYADVKKAIQYGVNHLSMYSLTVEKGTLYSRKIQEKKKQIPDESIQYQILQNLPNFMNAQGFHQYEVSNYAQPDMESRHNLKYWTMNYYLALGPGAHGYTPGGRYFNPRAVDSYVLGKFGEKYEKSILKEELAICLLRIFSPIEILPFLEIMNSNPGPYLNLFRKWEDRGLCDWDGEIFQWKPNAVLDLDTRIFEFSEI